MLKFQRFWNTFLISICSFFHLLTIEYVLEMNRKDFENRLFLLLHETTLLHAKSHLIIDGTFLLFKFFS